MSKSILFLSIGFLLIGVSVFGQKEGKDITIGKEYILTSEILKQERPILVHLPNGYEEGEEQYPVIYLLDGRGNFHHTTATVDFLSRNGQIPSMIVVGIPNTDDRTRDLTPILEHRKEQFPTAGGAENMLSFIEKELMPYINKEYRTENYNMLIGHSFGGLFVTHALLHHPNIFNSYISISPSLWWDEQRMVKEQTDNFFNTQQDLVGHLYMTMGNEGGAMLGGAWKLAALLEEKSPNNFHWAFDLMEEETHTSIPMRSTYKGLQFIFKDWNLREQEEFIAAEGIDAYEDKIEKLYGLEQKWDERTLMRMGERLMQKEQYPKAVPIFKKATILSPESEQAWFMYGASLVKSGQETEAEAHFKKVLALNPESMQAKVALRKIGSDDAEGVPDLQLSNKELENYAGTYHLEIGMIANLSVEDQQLWVSGQDIPKEALFPIEKHTFYLTSMNAKIIFELKADKVVGFKVESDRGNFGAIKK